MSASCRCSIVSGSKAYVRGAAQAHAETYRGKPWMYLLIPHDAIAENMTLKGLTAQFEPR